MVVEEIPQELIDMINEDANMDHSSNGKVLQSLARILTRYKEMLEDGSFFHD